MFSLIIRRRDFANWRKSVTGDVGEQEMKKRLVIRQAGVADAEALAELARRTCDDTFAAVNTPENMKAYLSAAFSVEQLATELRDPRGTFLMADLEGQNAGYAK